MKVILPLSIAFAVFSLQAQTQSTSQATASATSSNQASAKDSEHMPSAKARLSDEVSDLLNATNEARVALEAHNKQDAQFHIDHALDNAKMIRSSAANRRFVPLYDELDRYSVLGPIMSQRNQSKKASNDADRQASDASHIAQARTTVQEVEGQFTSVALDVQSAMDHLEAAKQALQNGNYQKADEALAAVQDGVVVTSISADLPVLRVRENLILARSSAHNGNISEAKAALKAASVALGNYENGQGKHGVDARKLRSEIDSYAQSIQNNHADAAAKIDQWWNETTEWITPGTGKGA